MIVSQELTIFEQSFAADVQAGLNRTGQKELPSKYLYDAVGSRLFDVITALPEYGVTRAEERILREHAAEIVERLHTPLSVAELGSGSGQKTRGLLEALCHRDPTSYYPIEISPAALAMCKREVGDIQAISILGLERDYLDGLAEVAAQRRQGKPLLVLFLGSTIGNFDPPAAASFLQELRGLLQPGDSLLLGTDLEKPVPVLLNAYDDSIGVTAAFNLNLLGRINRELDGHFDLSQFAHEARFNPTARRVEMHLRSTRRQRVAIEKADMSVTFEEGETIWTESSHKYSLSEVLRMAHASGFRCEAQWIDHEWLFAESLWIAQ
ncbi:MAG TPA: L-histidine N(alpha)-methyltransferase [Bryobacteraceae bacterium]|nr:L-histidine N(alpha)-methyltransferase [Bryobacteraceae bacterium]